MNSSEPNLTFNRSGNRSSFSPSKASKHNSIIEKTLDLNLAKKRQRESLKYGSIYVFLLSVLIFDLSNKCPFAFSRWYYVEYAASGILALLVVYHFGQYFLNLFNFEPIRGTEEQRKILKFEVKDASFVTTPAAKKHPNQTMTPGNITTLSFQHNSYNDSLGGVTMASPGWTYGNGSTNISQSFNQSGGTYNKSNASAQSFVSPYKQQFNENEFIMDEKSLQKYLKEVDQKDKESFAQAEATQSFVGGMSVGGGGNFNSIWNSYGSGIAEMVGLLKTNLYQLAPTSVSPKQSKNDDGSMLFGGETAEGYPEILKNLSSSKLSSSVANLRMWIAATILRRIVAEINVIDEAFKTRGFSEIQIGSVGLERLKKTAENQQFVALHVPMLPLLIPFLELSSNQEYLVKRLKELAKSSCITDYRWNSGSSYNGVAWDEHLPTDSAIIFHLFCTYLDSQLRPLPSPGGRPFYNRYVVEAVDKKSPKETLAEVKNKCKCAILCTSPLKPKFNFISDEKIHNCAHNRNNLFYVIIQFLLYMKNHHEGLLEGVSLGKSGINILGVIEDQH